jgi:hypothetical protein
MKRTPSLRSSLPLSQLPMFEIIQLISWHFPKASHDPDSNPRTVVYYGADDAPLLSIDYSNKGEILDVRRLPALTDEDLEGLVATVHAEAKAPPVTGIFRKTAFARVPVIGAWRCGDICQIVPAPVDAPRPNWLAAQHPFILEVPYRVPISEHLRMTRSHEAFRQVELLLNLVVRGGISSYGLRPRAAWTLAHAAEQAPSRVRPEFRQLGYVLDGEVIYAEDFCELGELCRVVGNDEYYRWPPLTRESSLTMPALAEQVLTIFPMLSQEQRRRFLRACYWNQMADKVAEFSASSAYAALIQAVETLIDVAPGSEPCVACGERSSGRATSAFQDLVERYAPNTKRKMRTRMYDLRSRVVHGNGLLLDDEDTLSWDLNPRRAAEQDLTDEAKRIVRFVLLGWLIDHAQEELGRQKGSGST